MASFSALRRARIGGLAASLALAGGLIAPAPAEAGVLDGPTSQNGGTTSGDGTCSSSGTPTTTNLGTFAADGVPVTTTASVNSTWTKGGNPSDITTASGTTTNKITATQAAGALKTVDISVNHQTAITSALGTAQDCEVELQIGVAYGASFDLPTPKTVTVDITSKNTYGVLLIQHASDSQSGSAQEVAYELHNQVTQEVYLPAGKYVMQSQILGVHNAPTPAAPSPQSKSGYLTAHIQIDDAGSAKDSASGAGTKYLALDAVRSCAAGALTGTWKSKAGKGKNAKIKKAVFRVNGAKVRTVKKPKKGKATTLTGLDPEQAAEVEVTLKLVEKGAGKITLERSYRPCS